MTKDEIKALVAAKIAGQGSAIDAASVLPTILDAIIDLIPEEYSLPVASAETLGGIKVGGNLSINAEGALSGVSSVLSAHINDNLFSNLPADDAASRMGISEDELDGLFSGKYLSLLEPVDEENYIVLIGIDKVSFGGYDFINDRLSFDYKLVRYISGEETLYDLGEV